jgi:hypothetical protein
MSVFFIKGDGNATMRKKARVGNVAPGILTTDLATVGQVELITPTETVTQATSITTGVTLNARKGLITTFTPSTAAVTATIFTVTNSFATTTSNIEAYVVSYGGTLGTNGVPLVMVKARAAGSFDIAIYNTDATNALATSLVIGFEIKR